MVIQQNFNEAIIGVTPIKYTVDELLSLLKNKEWYLPIIKNKCESRKIEQLTVRYLIYMLLGEEKEINYSPSGKPFFADGSYYISISHTKGYVAVILNKKNEVGIDIEYVSPRVNKIRSRFMNQTEEENISKENETIHSLLHWSAKEALFKILEYNDIDFKLHLHMDAFIPEMYKWAQFGAYETRSNEKKMFIIDYLVAKDYVLTAIK